MGEKKILLKIVWSITRSGKREILTLTILQETHSRNKEAWIVDVAPNLRKVKIILEYV